MKSQSEVVFDEERNAHISRPYGSNEINLIGLPEDEEYVDETDTGDEPLPDSQPTQIGKKSKSFMYEAPDEEAEIAHCRRLRWENPTGQHLVANGENIAHSRHLRREDQIARRLAAVINQWSQVPQVAPAPMVWSRVTRCQSKACAEASTASTEAPYTYAEAMERPQQDHLKRALEEESTSMLLNNTFSALNSQEAGHLRVKPTGSKWVYKT